MTDEELQLYLFKLKAQAVINNPFTKSLINTRSTGITKKKLKNWPNLYNHRKSTIDSFVLNFRFLLLNRDGINIYNIRKILAERKLLSKESKNLFKKFDKFKKISSLVKSINKKYTNEHFFNVLFYGGLAHHNKDLIREFLAYKSNITTNILAFMFFKSYVLQIINISRHLCKDYCFNDI